MYGLFHGRLFLIVCWIAFQTVRNPKPRVNPAATEATWISDVEDIFLFPTRQQYGQRPKSKIKQQKKLEEARPIGPVALYMYRGFR